jgi:hypothetical protein
MLCQGTVYFAQFRPSNPDLSTTALLVSPQQVSVSVKEFWQDVAPYLSSGCPFYPKGVPCPREPLCMLVLPHVHSNLCRYRGVLPARYKHGPAIGPQYLVF